MVQWGWNEWEGRSYTSFFGTTPLCIPTVGYI